MVGPPSSPPAHEFLAPVLRQEAGFRYYILPLPADVADAFAAAKVRRLAGTLNGHPVRRAIQGRADGERYLVLSQPLLRAIGAAFGDTVEVALWADPDPDLVELGEELAAVLAEDEEAAARFNAFTPGRQRGLAHYVTSAKRPETRHSRAMEIAHKLRTYTLYGDLHPLPPP